MRSGPHRAHCRGRDSREVKERSPLADLLRLALLEAGRIMKAWSQAMFKLNLLVLAKLNIPHFNVIYDLLGSFISTFFYKYMWPQTSRSHATRLQRSHAPFAVHVWTSGGAVTGTWTSSTLFLFLFESSHVCPINICEVRSFLITNPFGMPQNQSFSYILCMKWRTSIFVSFKMEVNMLIFFSWKPTSI